jgi:DNA-binding IclR family transcriptional regulator
MDKATTYRLLTSLREKNLVQRIGDGALYGLGPACVFFAEAFRENFTIRERVQPHVKKLVGLTGESAFYCERFQRNFCVTVERWESPFQTRTMTETGLVRPLYSGCSGQAILAMLPAEEINEIISDKPLVRYTPFTPGSMKQLRKKIDDIVRRGYAVSIQERTLYTTGVAAPIFDHRSVIGSLGILGPKERVAATGIEKIGQIVGEIAGNLSEELGSIRGLDFARERKFRLVGEGPRGGKAKSTAIQK